MFCSFHVKISICIVKVKCFLLNCSVVVLELYQRNSYILGDSAHAW